MLELSPTQSQVLDQIVDWYKSGAQAPLTVGGYAGTGKTTLISELRHLLNKEFPKIKVAFCSFTGKATRVLESTIKSSRSRYKGDSISTIHALIYSPIKGKDDEIVGWKRKDVEEFDYQLLIVDEASMVTQELWQDLLSYKVPVLAVGDHGQLPPIGSNFNLMAEPILRLEEIFRQQEGNPIIKLSMLARKEGSIPFGDYGRGVRKIQRQDPDTQEFLGELLVDAGEDMLVLTGYNHTRVRINQAIRQLLEFETPKPQKGDRVICLRNNHQHLIYNGMTGQIQDIRLLEDPSGEYYQAEIMFDGESTSFKGDISVEQFGQSSTMKDERRKGINLFDFGYALTVHKSQGSQADTVVVFEERFAKMDDDSWRRWLYTAVTRAKQNLYIVG